MGTQDVINYVMNTPGNTNRAVLGSMLDSIGSGSGNSILIVHFTNDNESDYQGKWSCDKNISDIDEALKNGTPVVGVAILTLNGQITFCETVDVSFQAGTYNVYIGSGTIWKGAGDQLPPTQWNITWNS